MNMGRHLARVERRGRRLVASSALQSAMRLDLLCLGHNFIVRYFPHSVRHRFKPHNDPLLLNFSKIPQPVRHCRRDHAHGGADGKPRAWHQYPNRIQRRGDPLSTVGQYQVGKYFCDRWQSAPYAHALWSVWRSQRPAPVLRVVLYYAHRMINERT